MNTNKTNIGLVLTMMLLFFSLQGCGPPKLKGLVPGKGIVMVDGVPTAGITLTFIPVENTGQARTASAMSMEGGEFDLMTFDAKDGLFPGEYTVTAVQIEVLNKMTNEEVQRLAREHKHIPPVKTLHHLPPRYGKAETSGISVTITPKGNTDIVIELNKK